MVSATFGPSQTKLLSTGKGKLEVARKAKCEWAASLPGKELMGLCKKEATVYGRPVCGQSQGEHDPDVPFLLSEVARGAG